MCSIYQGCNNNLYCLPKRSVRLVRFNTQFEPQYFGTFRFFTLPHINADLLPSFFPVHFQVRQKPPAGRSGRQQPAGSSSGAAGGGGGGGGSSGASSNSSSARASPAGTMRAPSGQHGRPPLASNFSLDDITAQMEKVKYLIDC